MKHDYPKTNDDVPFPSCFVDDQYNQKEETMRHIVDKCNVSLSDRFSQYLFWLNEQASPCLELLKQRKYIPDHVNLFSIGPAQARFLVKDREHGIVVVLNWKQVNLKTCPEKL